MRGGQAMKKFFIVCMCVVLAIVVALFAAKNILIKTVLTRVVAATTGLRLEIASVDAGVIKSAFGARGIRLFNPSGFQDQLMCDIPEVYVDYDVGGFFKNKIHLKTVRLDMRQFTVETNQKGVLNVAALTALKPQGQGKKAPELAIDRLDLKIGKVIYKGHDIDGRPVTQEFALNMDERLEHVTNPTTLVNLILSRALKNADLSALVSMDFKAMKKGFSRDVAGQAASKIIDTILPKNTQ
jgi:hypothetical protein